MTFQQIIDLQKFIKKGCYYKIDFKSVQTLKGNTIEKFTSGVGRFGLAYKNLKENKDIVTNSLPYGEWEIANFVIRNKDKLQVRIYPSRCKNHKMKSFYKLNGQDITKEELIEMGLLKVKPHKEISCFNIMLENLIDIHVKNKD